MYNGQNVYFLFYHFSTNLISLRHKNMPNRSFVDKKKATKMNEWKQLKMVDESVENLVFGTAQSNTGKAKEKIESNQTKFH